MAQGAIYGRVLIRGEIECLTGLHIGVETKATEIGGMDAPVVRDPVTLEPYIPGSSLKGKMRSLMERREFVNSGCDIRFFNRSMQRDEVRQHQCDDPECKPCRIFGTAASGGQGRNRPARLIVRDCPLINADELKDVGTGLYTEAKMENTLDRITSAASPRTIERVVRGAKFSMELVYDVEDPERVTEDLKEVLACLRLLEDDYLGGSGSRGYGRIAINNVEVELRRPGYYLGTEEPTVIKPVDGPSLDEVTKSILDCVAEFRWE